MNTHREVILIRRDASQRELERFLREGCKHDDRFQEISHRARSWTIMHNVSAGDDTGLQQDSGT